MNQISEIRRYDIDWLRVLLFGLLILLHNVIGFSQFGDLVYGYSNNDLGGPLLELFIFFTHGWRLPALFIIAGMGTCFAFKKRSSLAFLCERLFRLFIPLLFASLFINVIQGYFRFINDGSGIAFNEFVIGWWTRANPDSIGVFEFELSQMYMRVGHLWFLVNLLLYSLIALPLFAICRRWPKNFLLSLSGRVLKLPFAIGLLFLLPLPLVLIELFIKPWMGGLIGFGYEFFWFFIFFLLGYICIAAGNAYWESLHKARFALLILSCLSFSGSLAFVIIAESIKPGYGALLDRGGWVHVGDSFWNLLSFPMCILHSMNAWWWSLSIFAWGSVLLNRTSKWLAYMNQAVYPFYIFHMTFCLVGLYYIKAWALPWPIKLGLLNAIVFLGCWFMFELVKRTRFTRALFGIKPLA